MKISLKIILRFLMSCLSNFFGIFQVRFIILSSNHKIDLHIKKVEEKYPYRHQEFSYFLWINKNTSEILDPKLYDQFDDATIGKNITIDHVKYCIKDIVFNTRRVKS